MSVLSCKPFHLTQIILCPACGTPLRFSAGERLCCNKPSGPTVEGNIVRCRTDISSPEMIARDMQAAGYLAHAKLPAQIDRMRRFIAPLCRSARPVLDLGCGPGPTTQMLSEMGFEIVAVDFSKRSLELNKAKSAIFVQADLNDIRFAKGSVDGLMMADFLQHLGDLDVQEAFLHRTFEALAPRGWFFLSCFNTNIKNMLRRNIEGTFAGGKIRYHRVSPSRIVSMLPSTAHIESVRPMSIFHSPFLDDIVTRFPFAYLIARMVVVTGRKH